MTSYDCKLSVGSRADAQECLALRASITQELARAGTSQLCLAQESDEEFCAFFDDEQSFALLLRDSASALAAFGIATFRGESREQFRRLIPDFDRSPHYVGYVKLIQVARQFRGQGFQKRLFGELEKRLFLQGARFATGTVSPDNIPSLRAFISCGYEQAEAFTHVPTGFARLRMIKNLEKTRDFAK